MKSIRHPLIATALVAALGCGIPVHAQMGAGGGNAGATQGGQASPSGETRGLPGGAPGVQREPLNPLPDTTTDDTRERPPSGLSGNPDSGQGSGATTMSDDEIHQACMMKANPQDCRTRMRNGETDPSIERNPP